MKNEHFGFFEAESDIPPRDVEVCEELDTKWTGTECQGEWGGSEWECEGQINRNSRDHIRWVQASLNKILGTRLTVHGVMGAQTRSAIRSFQKRKRLKVDGIVGRGTEAALIAAGAVLSPLTTPAIPGNINDLLRLVGVIVSSLPAVVSSVVKLPTAARLLDAAEQSEARTIYGRSLDFAKILIADELGFQKRMFTVAVPLSAGSLVVMMMGDLCSWATRPRSATLIHELAHAWQSQHHGSDAQAFMKNSVLCQVRALAALPRARQPLLREPRRQLFVAWFLSPWALLRPKPSRPRTSARMLTFQESRLGSIQQNRLLSRWRTPTQGRGARLP